MRIGKPWRHLLQQHRFLHSYGPWSRLFIGEQGKRSGLAGTMAALAVLLQNRQNVLGKGHPRTVGRGSYGHSQQDPCDRGFGTHKSPSPPLYEVASRNMLAKIGCSPAGGSGAGEACATLSYRQGLSLNTPPQPSGSHEPMPPKPAVP